MAGSWYIVGQRAKVWSSTKETHKMGFVNPGNQVEVVEFYGDWRRFAGSTSGELFPTDEKYHEYWVRNDEAQLTASSVVTSPSVSDAELGAAVRTIWRALHQSS